MNAAWHWFVAQNGVKDIVATLIAIGLAHAVGWRPRRHQQLQEKIADRLDTSTPGGLADIVPKDKPG